MWKYSLSRKIEGAVTTSLTISMLITWFMGRQVMLISDEPLAIVMRNYLEGVDAVWVALVAWLTAFIVYAVGHVAVAMVVGIQRNSAESRRRARQFH